MFRVFNVTQIEFEKNRLDVGYQFNIHILNTLKPSFSAASSSLASSQMNVFPRG